MCVRIYFRVFFSLLPLWVVDADRCAEGVITVNPQRMVVKYGDSVEANCTALVPHGGIGWEASVGNSGIEEDVQQVTWTVKELTEWKVSAMCFINQESLEPEQCILSLTVIVYKELENAPVLSANHTGPMIEGAIYQLLCDIYNIAPIRYLIVTWYRDGVLIGQNAAVDNSTDKTTPVNVTSTLLITPTRLDNGAKFLCEAELNFGEEGPQPPPPKKTSQDVSITVHYGPETANCPYIINISEGEDLEKFCNSVGNPHPTITWLRYGQPIDPSHPLTREDSDTYTVIVTGLSPFERLINVFVMFGPELFCPSSYLIEEYKAYTQPCLVEGYPTPDIQWFKDGEDVVLPEYPSRGDGGQYLIVANSSHGTATHLIDIKVLYPPSHIDELEDTEVDEVGSEVVLKCSSYGDPRPQYSWRFYQVENVWVNNEDGVSLLHINGARGENIGIYTCFAFNKLGEVNKSVTVSVKGVQAPCPIEFSINGKQVNETVVEYGQAVSVKCSARGQAKLQWSVSPNHSIVGDTWSEAALTDWNANPRCKGTFEGRDSCQKLFNVTLFKTPEVLSIHFQNHSEPVHTLDGKNYTLICGILNIAPVRNLIVTWYKEIKSGGKNRSSDIRKKVQEERFSKNTTKTPQSVYSTISIYANKSENGVLYWCEAELMLGAHGFRQIKSPTLSITVHYKPVITSPNVSVVPVFSDYREVLICEAEGNPRPEVIWIFNNKSSRGANVTISTEMAGLITCSARNMHGNVLKTVELVPTVDYLPLIAGFVAVAVVITSVIFIFIYSIYYTNTKMGHYSLKDAKPNTQKGDVAQNGLDSSLPMKKLSQQNIYVLGVTP